MKHNPRMLFTIGVHSLLGCSPFIFMVAPNQIEIQVKQFINESLTTHYHVSPTEGQIYWIWSLIAAGYGFGVFCSFAPLAYLLRRVGLRDVVLIWKNVFTVACCLIQYLGVYLTSWELLLIGRILSGLPVLATLYIPTLVAECAPTQRRGMYGALAWFGDPIWTILGTIFGLPMVFGGCWWAHSLLAPVPAAILHLMCTPFIPKSPKQLYLSEMDSDEAERSVIFYHGRDANVKEVFVEFDKEAASTSEQSAHDITVWKLFTQPEYLRPLLLVLVINTGTFCVGVDIVFLYSTESMRLLFGIDATTATVYTVVFCQLPALLAGVAGVLLVDRLGRRPLLMFGYSVAIVAMVGIFCTDFVTDPLGKGILGVGGLLLIQMAYNGGPCFICELLPGELSPTQSRHLTTSIGLGAPWLLGTFVMIGYSPLEFAVGSYAVLPLLAVMIFVLVFIYFLLPETAGREVHSIVAGFANDEAEKKGIASGKKDYGATRE